MAKKLTVNQGRAVKTNKVLYPFYWDRNGNPDVIVPVGAVGIVANGDTQGDVIIDFPIYTADLVNTWENHFAVGKVWRVRMTLKEAAECLEKVDTPDWLKFHFFCGGLMLDCDLPSMFNRVVVVDVISERAKREDCTQAA